MSILDRYYAALDQRAGEERAKAAQAKSRGDEREHSIHLMQSSMLGDMLRTLGRVQHEGARPGILDAQIRTLEAETERQREKGDFDAADRAQIKAQTIAWAQDVLRELEQQHE